LEQGRLSRLYLFCRRQFRKRLFAFFYSSKILTGPAALFVPEMFSEGLHQRITSALPPVG
jgi:hypothetical protein